MDIRFYATNSLTNASFRSYAQAFNEIFGLNRGITYFKKKYLNTPFGYSFHCFVYDNNRVVAACSVIPYTYNIAKAEQTLGLAVDTFIHEEFRRKNPFLLLQMYQLIKKELKKKSVIAVIAIPNSNAYSYWKKVVGFKDLMNLRYYGFVPNVLSIFGISIDLFSKPVFMFSIWINSVYNFLLGNRRMSVSNISLIKHDIFRNQRYIDDQIIVENESYKSVFAIVLERNIKVAYLIDFENKRIKAKDYKSLIFALKQIKYYGVDMLLYIGQIKFRQFVLFKIPERLEPKPLNLIIDVVDREWYEALIKYEDWDFGLINFDVR